MEEDEVTLEDFSITEPAPVSPFEKIALCFSGGGFRAAAYSLGVLSLFNEIPFDHTGQPMLRHVGYISSASGGTITAAMYALRSTEPGFSFDKFYKEFLTILQGDELLKSALDILTTDSYWQGEHKGKARNLINAFSIAYSAAGFFNGATFQHLLPKPESFYHHLEEVCFNSTDLFKGHTFRQQLCVQEDLVTKMYFGNHYLRVDKTWALKIKLADALAASSCFPAGFEPMAFPNDFLMNDIDRAACIADIANTLCNSNVIATDEEVEAIKTNGFGLMDGGITDNQGLDSLMMADQRSTRRLNEKGAKKLFGRFDFIMVNDVSSHFMESYKVPNGKGSFLTKALTLQSLFLVVMGVFVLSTVGLITQFLMDAPLAKVAILFPSAILFGASATILVIWYCLRQYIFSTTKSGMNLSRSFSPEIVNRLYDYLSKTHLHVLALLGAARLKSVISLNTDLFLKHNRRMIYDNFYGSNLWRNRGKGNHIYDLSFTNKRRIYQDINNFPAELRSVLTPSPKIMDVAQQAFEMSTTLWFDKAHQAQDMRAKIIATGQFTTCYNLILHIMALKKSEAWGTLGIVEKDRVEYTNQHLMALWAKFQENPMFLHNEAQHRQTA